jgi:hypothetical protein
MPSRADETTTPLCAPQPPGPTDHFHPISGERSPMRQDHRVHFYDILGSRIIRLQDRLAGLEADDPRREVLIAILTELDELKRDLVEAGIGED